MPIKSSMNLCSTRIKSGRTESFVCSCVRIRKTSASHIRIAAIDNRDLTPRRFIFFFFPFTFAFIPIHLVSVFSSGRTVSHHSHCIHSFVVRLCEGRFEMETTCSSMSLFVYWSSSIIIMPSFCHVSFQFTFKAHHSRWIFRTYFHWQIAKDIWNANDG